MADSKDRSQTRGITVFLVVTLLTTALIWRGCWYGSPLSDTEIETYLEGGGDLGDIHKALNKIDERLVRGDSSVEKFFPLLVPLCEHEDANTRKAVAWVMSDAELHNPFRVHLLKLTRDPNILVRLQAALGLARHTHALGIRSENPSKEDMSQAASLGTASRDVLLTALDRIPIEAPSDGKISDMLRKGEPLITGMRLARIQSGDGSLHEVLSPLDGKVVRTEVTPNQVISRGDVILQVQPGDAIIRNALVGLYMVGKAEDAPIVRRLVDGHFEVSEETLDQARQTARRLENL